MKWKAWMIEYRRVILFYAVGSVNALVDLGVYSGVLFLSKSPVASQIAGYLAGVVTSFLLNRGVTFRSENGGSTVQRQIIRFLLVNLVSLLFSLGAIHLLANSFGINGYLAKFPVAFMTSLINFTGYRLFVFPKHDGKEEPHDA